MQKKSKKITIDDLALMVGNGFEGVAKDSADIKADIQTLQTDVSDIKLRLDNLAPKFEVRDLEKRVRRLEEKAGVRHIA